MTTGSAAQVEVVAIGRANVDLILRLPHRPIPGETVFASGLVTSPGGKALNQAIAVARLGGSVAIIANVGDDAWGRLLHETLNDAGVDTTHLQQLHGAGTGAAVIEVTPDAENSVVLAVSETTELTGDDIRAALAGLHAPVVVIQLDLPPDPVLTAVNLARSSRRLIGNLVPHPDMDRRVLADLDVLVVNEHEATEILGNRHSAPRAAAEHLRRLGPRSAVVTAGPAGAAYATPTASGAVPAPTIEAVDTTGAGDAFLGALALRLARRRSLRDAVSDAVVVGTRAVLHHGPQLPPFTPASRRSDCDRPSVDERWS